MTKKAMSLFLLDAVGDFSQGLRWRLVCLEQCAALRNMLKLFRPINPDRL